MPGFDEDKVYDEELYLLDNTPMVTRVTVDQEKDTISVEGTNFNRIVWVSDCNVIKRTENITNGKAVLDLHASDLMNEPNLYVRFYITGENGICYSQPFVLNVEGEGLEPVEVPETLDPPAHILHHYGLALLQIQSAYLGVQIFCARLQRI